MSPCRRSGNVGDWERKRPKEKAVGVFRNYCPLIDFGFARVSFTWIDIVSAGF